MEGFRKGGDESGDEAGVRGRESGSNFGEDVRCAGTDFGRGWLGGGGGLRRMGSERDSEDDREERREELMHLMFSLWLERVPDKREEIRTDVWFDE